MTFLARLSAYNSPSYWVPREKCTDLRTFADLHTYRPTYSKTPYFWLTCEILVFFYDQNGSGKRNVRRKRSYREPPWLHNRDRRRFNLEESRSPQI